MSYISESIQAGPPVMSDSILESGMSLANAIIHRRGKRRITHRFSGVGSPASPLMPRQPSVREPGPRNVEVFNLTDATSNATGPVTTDCSASTNAKSNFFIAVFSHHEMVVIDYIEKPSAN